MKKIIEIFLKNEDSETQKFFIGDSVNLLSIAMNLGVISERLKVNGTWGNISLAVLKQLFSHDIYSIKNISAVEGSEEKSFWNKGGKVSLSEISNDFKKVNHKYNLHELPFGFEKEKHYPERVRDFSKGNYFLFNMERGIYVSIPSNTSVYIKLIFIAKQL